MNGQKHTKKSLFETLFVKNELLYKKNTCDNHESRMLFH